MGKVKIYDSESKEFGHLIGKKNIEVFLEDGNLHTLFTGRGKLTSSSKQEVVEIAKELGVNYVVYNSRGTCGKFKATGTVISGIFTNLTFSFYKK